MTRIARKSDGRRIFSDSFKDRQIARVLRGELTVSELSRKLGIATSLLHRWKRRAPRPGAIPQEPRPRPVPAGRLGTAEYIRELQVLVGKQTIELELLRAELEARQQGRPPQGPTRR